MNGQQITRRLVLGAAVVIVAAAAALGVVHDARADFPNGDYESASLFKMFCEAAGGTFSRDGLGNTECHYPNGDWEVCDANGNDCWYIPVPFQPTLPDDHAAPGDIAGADPNPDGASDLAPTGGTHSPVADSPTSAGAQPGVAAPSDDRDQDRDNGKKTKKGKKGKKGGKGRKK